MESLAADNVSLFEQALRLLSQFGWRNGYRKLQEWLPASDDPVTRSIHAWFLGWQAWERGDFTETRKQLESVQEPEACRAWALTGLAFTAMRQRDPAAEQLMDEAAALASPADEMLTVVMDQGRGAIAFHRGDVVTARRLFAKALAACGDQHFLTGRIYDAIGMTWLGTGNFYIAVEFFHRALAYKERPPCGEPDLPGLALTHGQLGRLYLDWGLFDQAEQHFHKDLSLCERFDDQRGRAQMLDALGRVALARLEAEGEQGDQLQRNRWLDDAAGWIEGCLKAVSGRSDWKVIEGYARLDQARVLLHRGNLPAAKEELSKSEELFEAIPFAEGNANVDLIRGRLARLEHDWPESLRLLNKSLRHFEATEPNMVPRVLLEVARTRRDSGEPRPVIAAAYRSALESAEQSRRSHIVAEVERELELVDPLERLREEQRRSRGRLVRRSTVSLMEAERDTGSVLYLDIQGSTQFARHRDPQEVLLTFNQMMADLAGVLRQFQGQVSSYRGDGFLALFRGVHAGQNHAVRAVEAALDLIGEVELFNEPRRLLGLPPLVVRIGVATGELCFGNVGTYDKMDFTVVGTPANLGARLEGMARPGQPCISDVTRETIGQRFRYTEDSPVEADAKGLGKQRVWFVVGRNETQQTGS